MKIDKSKLSPMMKKYIETKEEYSDCILFYRLGDFYEMFFDDALLASKLLNIALTGKSCGLDERAPMCGVPYHSASSYIAKLIEMGYKVAIGEQVEDPATTKGLVKREVVKIVTPGTYIEENEIESKRNNYLMSIYFNELNASISYVDISTGELNVTEVDIKGIKDEVLKISPSEIITNDINIVKLLESLCKLTNTYLNDKIDLGLLESSVLEEVFKIDYLDSLDIINNVPFKYSISMILNYIRQTQKLTSSNINKINVYNSGDFMSLDNFTRINLELTSTIRGGSKKGSLLNILDKTSTPMGGRKLRKFIEQPLSNKEIINRRLDITEEIKNNFILRDDLKSCLSNVFDMERICAKIAYDRVLPKDLINLKLSIEKLPEIIECIKNSNIDILMDFANSIDPMLDIYSIIENSIKDDPANALKEGNIIKSEYSKELEELRDISDNGAYIIKDIEKREREKTGAKTLKVGYNKVFGYYIEITKAALLQVNLDETYIRKQTLVNAERFITEELKEVEDKIINAEDKIKNLEYDIFREIRNIVYENIDRIQSVASIVAELDVYVSNAIVANKYNYVKPIIGSGSNLKIVEGRHPVIEQIMGEENFIPNDTSISNENLINIITGPNMSGKSTYMRQVAIIALMAHIGLFVPASSAEIPILDRIFTRVGASDDLAQGQSTFMVEMNEVSQILSNASKNSLVILDEVGRGTSTYDGISLAWSIVEYIHESIGAKTLFATHYHELTELESKYSNIKNYSVQVEENGDDIVFMRKIIPQAANRSYGIYVAKLAKLPEKVIIKADKILSELEKNHIDNSTSLENVYENSNKYSDKDMTVEQISFGSYIVENNKYDEIIGELISVDILNSTPMQIMEKMYEIQKKAKYIK